MTHSSHSLRQAGVEKRVYDSFGVASGKKSRQTEGLREAPVCRRSLGGAAAGAGERRAAGAGRGEGGPPLCSPSSSALSWERLGISPPGPSTVPCSRRAPRLMPAAFFSTSPLPSVRDGGRGVGDATFAAPPARREGSAPRGTRPPRADLAQPCCGDPPGRGGRRCNQQRKMQSYDVLF